MILSMTGFGKSTRKIDKHTITVEIRSLNSKNLDSTIRLPSLFREKEMEVRALLVNELIRGKVELSMSHDYAPEASRNHINKVLAKQYYKELHEIADELDIKENNLLHTVTTLPDVVYTEDEILDPELWDGAMKCIREALDNVMSFRKQEGDSLKADMCMRNAKIKELAVKIGELEPARAPKIRERIRQHLDKYIGDKELDQNRVEQEMIFYIEKLDITEEIVRLENHNDYFDEVINEDSNVNGKKLNFIAQEIGREINTIGAKANFSDIQKLVVLMKDELEKIKEQLNNIL